MSDSGTGLPVRVGSVRKPRPILFFLALLIAIIALPVLAYSTVLILRHNEAQSEVVETFTLATTRSALQSVEREVSGMVTTLRVLMASPSFIAGDYAEFHTRARLALEGTGANLIVVDAANAQLLNTRVPYGTPLDAAIDTETIARALASPDPQVSSVVFGRTAQTWVFQVARRFFEGSAPEGAVLLNYPAASLRTMLVGRDLPAGWDIALVDGANRVITTSMPDVATGSTLLLPLHPEAGSGWVDVTVDAVPYRTITQRSLLTGWYVVAWAPVAVVEAPIRSALLMLIGGGLALVFLAGAGAFLVAHQIARSVRGLVRDARALGAGEAVPPRAYPVAELGEVSVALTEAAQTRQAAEAETRLLMRELAHRSKNQLTVIGAMAKQTAQGATSVEAFLESFQRRIMGLARSTDLLVTHGAGNIALGDLIASQIEPFRPQDEARVVIAGPRVRLNVQAAQVLGMAIHELATNAAKYGAFSGQEGSVDISWRLAGPVLELDWREHVPDFVPPPPREGFGTVVIRKMVAGSLSAEIDQSINADGIAWRFDIPNAAIAPEAVEH